MPSRRTSSLKVVKTCNGVLAHQRLKEGLDRGGASNPEPGAVPEIWIRRAEEDGATKRDALGFWAIALAGWSPPLRAMSGEQFLTGRGSPRLDNFFLAVRTRLSAIDAI
jgi:hypothetical protein